MKQTRSRAVVLALCALLVVSVLTAVLASGCSSNSDDESGDLVTASGLAVTKEFDVAGFTSVQLRRHGDGRGAVPGGGSGRP